MQHGWLYYLAKGLWISAVTIVIIAICWIRSIWIEKRGE